MERSTTAAASPASRFGAFAPARRAYLAGLADELLRCRRGSEPLPPDAPSWELESEDEALAVQDDVAQRIGRPVAGWKLGATNAAARSRLGLARPFIGRVFATHRFDDGARAGPAFPRGCDVEVEIAFVLARALPARADAYGVDEVSAAIGSCHPAFELVSLSRAPRDGVAGVDVLADNGGCGGAVLGPAVLGWRTRRIAEAPVELAIDGRDAAPGAVSATWDELVGRLAWLADFLGARGIGLAAGHCVLTGTWIGMHRLSAGQTAVGRVAGLGEVRVRL